MRSREASMTRAAWLVMFVWERRHALGGPVVPEEKRMQMVEFSRASGEVIRVHGSRVGESARGVDGEEAGIKVSVGEVLLRVRMRDRGRLKRAAAAVAVGRVSSVQKMSLALTCLSWVRNSEGVEPGLEEEKTALAAMVP